jgi:hypothetical protein
VRWAASLAALAAVHVEPDEEMRVRTPMKLV